MSLVWAAVWVAVTSGPIGAIYVLAAFAVGATAYSFRDRVVLAGPVALRAARRSAVWPGWLRSRVSVVVVDPGFGLPVLLVRLRAAADRAGGSPASATRRTASTSGHGRSSRP